MDRLNGRTLVKKLGTFCFALLFSLASVHSQDPLPPTQPKAPTRVPGQPNSPQEMLAFNKLRALQTAQERVREGLAFLAAFPDSGLSSYVHYVLANAYGLNGPERYAYHAEIALSEFPGFPSLQANLAFIYAETGKTSQGAERGRAALQLIQGMQKPNQMTEANWLLQKLEVGGQSNYAIGRHLLGEADPEKPDSAQKLEQASQYFQRAVDQLPDDPYASFRLAESYLQRGSYDKAMTYLARTVAVGGSVGAIADTRLREIYQEIHSGTEGLNELLEAQRVALEEARAAQKAMLDILNAPQPPPGTPPPS